MVLYLNHVDRNAYIETLIQKCFCRTAYIEMLLSKHLCRNGAAYVETLNNGVDSL
jgi:hypothetical protein